MKNLRIVCRVVTYDPEKRAILLVRNTGQEWWYAPGGGWDHQDETIEACATREVLEETGIPVKIERLLYVQSLDIKDQDSTWLENFWLGTPTAGTRLPEGHDDHFGVVEEARWFTQSELQGVTVYPKQLKSMFWEEVDQYRVGSNRYIGHSVL